MARRKGFCLPALPRRVSKRTGILLALATAVLWGTMPLAGKVALTGASPYFITFFRFLTAGLVLAGLLLLLRRDKDLALVKRPPWVLLVASLGLVGNYVLYIVGLQHTTATAAQFMVQMGGVFLVAWSVLFLGERLTPARALGIALAVAGVLLVSWNGEPLEGLFGSEHLLGNLLVLASAASWSVYAALQKRLGARHSAHAVLVGVYLAGALFTSPGAFAIPWGASLLVWGFIAYLVLNTLLAYGAFAESLRHVDASVTTVITTFAPVVTVAIVATVNAFLPGTYPGDLTPYTLLGGGCILAGILVVIRER